MLFRIAEIPPQSWQETFQKCVSDPDLKAEMEKEENAWK